VKARKETPTDAVAIDGNLSWPQLDIQSSTRVKADDEAERRRYAKIFHSNKNIHPFSDFLQLKVAER